MSKNSEFPTTTILIFSHSIHCGKKTKRLSWDNTTAEWWIDM